MRRRLSAPFQLFIAGKPSCPYIGLQGLEESEGDKLDLPVQYAETLFHDRTIVDFNRRKAECDHRRYCVCEDSPQLGDLS